MSSALTLFPVVSSCLSLAARIWEGGWLGRGKNQLESWPGRVVVTGSYCTWWPVGDTGSLQDSGLALLCSSSLAMAEVGDTGHSQVYSDRRLGPSGCAGEMGLWEPH